VEEYAANEEILAILKDERLDEEEEVIVGLKRELERWRERATLFGKERNKLRLEIERCKSQLALKSIDENSGNFSDNVVV
jgi:hypothetical protein